MKWKEDKWKLFGVLTYLGVFLVGLFGVLGVTFSETAPRWVQENALPIRCALCGGLGGAIYLLRAVYLHCCVHDDWTADWLPWYFIRPVVSILCGLAAFVFLSATLITLESARIEGAREYGFYALAILAGLNVDRFVIRIEEIGKATFGIKKSRSAQNSERDE